MSEALFKQKAPGVMRKLMGDFPLDKLGAAAIAGNLGHESGGFGSLQEISPTVRGSRGGYGWPQWTGIRRRRYEAYCKRNGLDPASDAANYAYLFVELKGLEGDEAGAIEKVNAAEGLEAKVVAFEKAFLRAGVKHYPSRIAWAKKALLAYELERVEAEKPLPKVITREKEKEMNTRARRPTVGGSRVSRWITYLILVLAGAMIAAVFIGTAFSQDLEVVTPTAGSQLVDWVFSLLGAVATPVVAWVGWKLSTWLNEKRLLNKNQSDVLIGQNLHLGAIKALEYARQKVGPVIAGTIDDVASRNLLISTAADYLIPKMRESIDHFGFGPEEVKEFLEARLGIESPELGVAPVVDKSAQVSAVTGVIASQIVNGVKEELSDFISNLTKSSTRKTTAKS